jgi:hypothetical protein
MPGWELTLIIVLVIAVLVLAAAVAVLFMERRRAEHLRSRFGPEYERTVHEFGDRRRAEQDLARREQRVEKLHIHPLSVEDHDRFAAAWRADQARFVDDPSGAVTEADRLVQEVMKARGYPVADFDHRVEDISVDHPHLVENYLAAREIALRHRRGRATTEELRKALVSYRSLFDELLGTPEVTR